MIEELFAKWSKIIELDTVAKNDDSGKNILSEVLDTILAGTPFEPWQVNSGTKHFVNFVLQLPCGGERVFSGYGDIIRKSQP